VAQRFSVRAVIHSFASKATLKEADVSPVRGQANGFPTTLPHRPYSLLPSEKDKRSAMRTIEIEKSLLEYLQTKATSNGEAISEILRRELKISPPTVQIEIEDDVYNYILSKTASIGEPASTILARELHVEPDNPAANIVEFHIKHGTGNQRWNTAEEIISAKVGNILRIVNDDIVSHRPHTSGIPFPHPDRDILPGGHADYLLQAPFPSTPGAIESLYDHAFGQAAQFWIRVEQP
jgi:hypothetical protein